LFESYWFSNPGLVKYRYLLKGYEEQWNESKENRAVYSALPAGEYEFQVQSTIHLTFEDAPVQSYKFVIQPPFYSSWWFLSLATAVSILLFYGFIRWRENEIKRKQQLKREKIEFQLENLKAQINPHFLFNSFNTLITLIEEDSHQAVTYVEKLSDFYRSLLSYRDVELIPLKEEINLSKNYIFLLQHRHGDNLVVSYSLDLPVEEYVIPPLTLQMLIENAVKHNVVSKANPLHVFIGNTKFNELYVTNNLQLRSGDLPSTRFGLQSINARFELASNKPIVVVQTDTEFTVKLPLIKKSVI
jgi:sensor histidine kinase YesM